MTEHEAETALYLIRNQLDKLPLDGDSEATDNTLENAYKIVYEFWQVVALDSIEDSGDN